MKRILTSLSIITIISFACSCTPDILPDIPQEEEQIQNTDSDSSQTDPAPDPDPIPEPEPEPAPEPVEIFSLISGPYREVLYNEHKFVVMIRSNCGIEVEIPDEAKQWICECDGYDRSKGYIGFKVEGLPQTIIGEELIPHVCSGEDRTVEINFWNSTRTKSISVTVKQLCYGCSFGLEEGDDTIIEY